MTAPRPYCLSATGVQNTLPADEEFSCGVLETMRAQDGRIPLLPGHMARLIRSAHPDSATLARIEGAISDIARHTAHWPEGARVRLRYGVLHGELEWDFAIVPLEPSSPWEHGVALVRCETPVTSEASSSPFPLGVTGQSSEPRRGLALHSSQGCKLLRREVYQRAEKELLQYSGILGPELFHEGLLLDENGRVVEGLRSNLLIWRGGCWRSPSLHKCGVQGVMLNWLAGQVEISEDALSLRDIEQAEEVAVCNAVRGVVPVLELAFGPSPGEPGDAEVRAAGHGSATKNIQALITDALW